jgi:hypothetical protein
MQNSIIVAGANYTVLLQLHQQQMIIVMIMIVMVMVMMTSTRRRVRVRNGVRIETDVIEMMMIGIGQRAEQMEGEAALPR